MAHPASAAAGNARRRGARGSCSAFWGWDVPDMPFAHPARQSVDRQREVLEAFPAGGQVEGWVTLVGHDLASDELLVGAVSMPGPGVRRPHDDAPLADLVGRRVLPAAARHAPGGAPAAARRARRAPADRSWRLVRRRGSGGGRRLGHLDRLLPVGVPAARAGRGGQRPARRDVQARHPHRARSATPTNAGDKVDILQVAALAAGLERDVRVDPECFGAHDAFEWATVGGAAAAGMADRVGSLEPGKLADLVVHDAGNLQWSPSVDPVMALVWGTDGRGVRDVFVGGDLVVRDGRSTRSTRPSCARVPGGAPRTCWRSPGSRFPPDGRCCAEPGGREALTHTAVRHNVSWNHVAGNRRDPDGSCGP